MEQAAHLDSEPKRALCGVRAKQPFSTQSIGHHLQPPGGKGRGAAASERRHFHRELQEKIDCVVQVRGDFDALLLRLRADDVALFAFVTSSRRKLSAGLSDDPLEQLLRMVSVIEVSARTRSPYLRWVDCDDKLSVTGGRAGRGVGALRGGVKREVVPAHAHGQELHHHRNAGALLGTAQSQQAGWTEGEGG